MTARRPIAPAPITTTPAVATAAAVAAAVATAASIAVAALLALATPAAAADLAAAFADPAWDGRKIPAGQQCTKFGGQGATPALRVTGIPAGATAIVVEFNDRDFQPLSYNGGHGRIGFTLAPGATEATLPAVPGETDALPEGAFVERRNQASGEYARPGYLPPCSGGRNHLYFAEVKAVARDGGGKAKVLAETRLDLGRY